MARFMNKGGSTNQDGLWGVDLGSLPHLFATRKDLQEGPHSVVPSYFPSMPRAGPLSSNHVFSIPPQPMVLSDYMDYNVQLPSNQQQQPDA